MAKELKSIKINGNKSYVLVSERVKAFRENFPDWTLATKIVELTDKWCVMQAMIFDPNGKLKAMGTAYEMQGTSKVNTSSYIENCETSAWGRALGNLGIGIDESICSADELLMALKAQAEVETPEKSDIAIPTAEVFKEQLNDERASTEAVAEITTLSSALKQPLNRICERYRVNSLEELTPAQTTEIIAKLRVAEEKRIGVKE